MKLTKGKLSKLFHKKKQTMRRYKNQRKYRRASKTFRQRKPLNLHRSSMKKFVDPRKIGRVGGADPDEKVPLVVKPASEEAPAQNASAPASTTESTTEPMPTMESTPEPVAAPTTEPTPEQAPESQPEPMPEPAPMPEPEPAPMSETAPEPASEPETTKVDAIPTADAVPKQMDAENVKPESSLAPPSVSDALDIIANKIAKAVVKEMREIDSSSNQDANVAVPLAVNALVKQTQLAPE